MRMLGKEMTLLTTAWSVVEGVMYTRGSISILQGLAVPAVGFFRSWYDGSFCRQQDSPVSHKVSQTLR